MSTIENLTTEHQGWQLTAISESLGDLSLTVDNALSIGRGKDNDVVLGSKQVSRHHAELNVLNGELYVKDLGSSNGTMVNEQRLESNKSKHLMSGDKVNFAVFAFEVVHSQAAAHKPLNEEAIKTDMSTDAIVKDSNADATRKHSTQKLEAETMQTDSDKDDYPVSTEEVGAITQEKLEEELEAPIPIGDPDQQSQQPVTESTGAVDDRVQPHHLDETSREHFEELAEEADPEVLRAKQAAAAKFSGTVGVNHAEISHSEPSHEPTHSVKLTDHNPSYTESTTEKAVQYETETTTTTATSIEEKSSRPLTQTEAQIPEVSTDKSNMMIWVIMAIIIIVLAIWWISTGMNN